MVKRQNGILDSGSGISVLDNRLVSKHWQTKNVKTKIRGVSNDLFELDQVRTVNFTL